LPYTVSRHDAAAVYFPACLTRVMGREGAGRQAPGSGTNGAWRAGLQAPRSGRRTADTPRTLVEALVRVAARAGRPLHLPLDAPGLCCGVPFSSKGFTEGHRLMVNRAIERMWDWSDEGRLPIVIDTSPCAHGLQTCRDSLTAANQARFDRLRLVDVVTFLHDDLLPHLTPLHVRREVAVHPVCTVVKAGLAPKLAAIAQACAEDVLLPQEAGCCGFAGDRGFLVPELTEAATAREAAEVALRRCEGHYSSSRTCEIGLARATGEPYESIVFLLEEATTGTSRG
jgi:D-lactate dehydrogenase